MVAGFMVAGSAVAGSGSVVAAGAGVPVGVGVLVGFGSRGDGVATIRWGSRRAFTAALTTSRRCFVRFNSDLVRAGRSLRSAASGFSSGYAVARRTDVIFEGKADCVPRKLPGDFVCARVLIRPNRAA